MIGSVTCPAAMTPAPQNEYILTEAQLQAIEKWKNTSLTKEYRSWVLPIHAEEWIISDKDYHIALEYFHLEARPAPSLGIRRKYWMYRSHSGHLYHLLFDLLGREFPEDESLLADALMEVRENQTKHDAAIAAQARNQTLDELKAWFVKNKCNGCPYGGNLLDKINSLRGEP